MAVLCDLKTAMSAAEWPTWLRLVTATYFIVPIRHADAPGNNT